MPKGPSPGRFLWEMTPNPPSENISELLRSLMEAKGVDAVKLSYSTDVPQRFITALVSGDFKGLPSEPYIRGYLFKIAGVLETNPNDLWRSYRETADVHTSGLTDTLPANRFSLKRVSGRKFWVALVVLLFLVFLGIRLNSILGKPTLEVVLPETTTGSSVLVSGKVKPGDTLTLNNEVIYPNERGEFEEEVALEPGLNVLEFKVKRYLGRETTVIKNVVYEPQAQ